MMTDKNVRPPEETVKERQTGMSALLVEFEQIDQLRCCACDGIIPRECVAANVDPVSGVQGIKAKCEHCADAKTGRGYYIISRTLRDGRWQMGGVSLMTPPEARKFDARIDHLRGVSQVA
jgi:hypothetical protein